MPSDTCVSHEDASRIFTWHCVRVAKVRNPEAEFNNVAIVIYFRRANLYSRICGDIRSFMDSTVNFSPIEP